MFCAESRRTVPAHNRLFLIESWRPSGFQRTTPRFCLVFYVLHQWKTNFCIILWTIKSWILNQRWRGALLRGSNVYFSYLKRGPYQWWKEAVVVVKWEKGRGSYEQNREGVHLSKGKGALVLCKMGHLGGTLKSLALNPWVPPPPPRGLPLLSVLETWIR